MNTNRAFLSLRLAWAAAFGVAALCHAQPTNILYPPPSSGSRDNYTGAVGDSFKVGPSNVVVSHLGYYSVNTNTGLAISHYVGIFTGGAGQNPPVYGQVIVPAGTAALWISNYYWMPLDPPLLLSSNTTYTLVGLAQNGDGDAWKDLYDPGWNPAITGSATTSGGDGIYGPGNSTWPPASTGNNGANNTYGAPNMANIPVGPAYVGVQKTNITIGAGSTLTVLGFATGQQPISYQWYLGSINNPLSNQTNASLVIPNSATANSGTYFLIASNSLGSEQSSNVAVTVTAVPVSITQQPTNITVFANYPAAFSVAAIGTPPIYYQWSKNGAAIAGATASSYTLTASVTNNADIYSVVVSNYINSTPETQTSSNATLSVTYNLAYPQVFLHGYNPALAFNSYSGQVGGQFTTGATPALVTHLGYYAWPANCITNGTNVTCALTNSAHYVGLYDAAGDSLLGDSLIPQGTNPVINGYMWEPLDPPLVLAPNTQYTLDAQTFAGDDPWGDVYSLPDLSSYYAVQCDAIYGGAGWNGTSTSVNGKFDGDMYSAPNLAILAPATPDAWALPVQGITTNAGFTETLTAVVAGQAPISVQWYQEPGVLLANQTNLTLTLSNVTTSQSGSYYVIASNDVTHATGQSADVVVTINPDVSPQIFQDIAPMAPVAVQGSTVTFSGSFYGSPSFTYGWQLNGNPVVNNSRISGANGNVLTINDVQASDAGGYQLFATNAEGSGQTSVSTLTVVPILPFNNGVGFSSQGNTIYWPSTNVVQLTSGFADESNSAFSSYPLYVGGFQASFTYQVMPNTPIATADGASFCIQDDPRGAAALGGDGGQLGVGTPDTIMPSFELEFHIYTNNGVGGVGVSFDTNGVIGPVIGIQTNVDIASGDPINAVITYQHGVATVVLTDTVSNTVYTASTNINIPAVLGSSAGYVGFTAGDGADFAGQSISNFTFVSIPQLNAQISGTDLVLTWPADIGAYALEQNSNLATKNWTPVLAPPTFNGSALQETVPLSGTSSFYQLVLTNVPNF